MKGAQRPSVFLDASALYPALLRNVSMRLALHGLFRARWSEHVQNEWTRAALRDRPDLQPAKVERTRRLMDENIFDAIVVNYEHLIETIDLPDTDDRHVVAAAIHCGATIIVTEKLRHFPRSVLTTYGTEAQHPDVFILGLLENSPTEGVAACGNSVSISGILR